MMYTVMCYFDKDTEKFNPPFNMPMVLDDVIESIIDGVKKGKFETPKSFVAYHLGYFDSASAAITLNKEPKKVLDLADYVKD